MLLSGEMPSRHTLIPLLVVFLVIQGMLAGVPHHHPSADLVDQVVGTPSTMDAPDHCLACSVHVPVLAGAMPFGIAPCVGRTDAGVVKEVTISAFSIQVTSGPRGPPPVSDQD